ncbi:MAG: hypothetical protein ACHQFW_01450 [Chitinophagales bacterium]
MLRSWQKILTKRLHVNGMTLFPFILIQRKELFHDPVFINHERIHLRQQLELLVVLFYFIYGMNYLINYLKCRDHDSAYRNICFERESYTMEKEMGYLKRRKFFAWINYLTTPKQNKHI